MGCPRSSLLNEYISIILLSIIAFLLSVPVKIYCNELNGKEILSYIRGHSLQKDPFWLALLHYKKDVNGRYVSEADGKGFFLSKRGKVSPEEELAADVLAFLEPEDRYDETNMHPQCRFPARYKWVKSRFNLDFKDVSCKRFEEWAGLIRPKGMTIIYASGYLNNPASMFGHTFIRLDRREKGIETDLLSYVVNYAAIPTTSNALLYAILGLTGGFEGRFSTLPYYMKVKEYGSMENRDLWEYRLNVKEEQLDYITRHIWELGQTHFNYFYIDENCSYHILSLVQIAYPELDFREYFSVYTVPQDTIKYLLNKKGIVKDINFRPSLRTTAAAQIESLSPEELDIAIEIAQSKKSLKVPESYNRLSEERKVAVLETASTLYRLYKGVGLPEEEERQVALVEREILLMRSRLKAPSLEPRVKTPRPPHIAHGPAMLSMSAGIGKKGIYEGIELKPVLHDLVSREDGYEPLTQIDMLKLSLRFMNDYEKVFINNFDFIRIVSIAELKRWLRKLSWNLSLGVEADYRKEVEDMKYLDLLLRGGPGVGVSSHIFLRETYFVFLENRLRLGIDQNFSIETGILAGTLWKMSEYSDLIIYGDITKEIFKTTGKAKIDHNLNSELAIHLSPDRDLRLKARINPEYYEVSLSFALFF